MIHHLGYHGIECGKLAAAFPGAYVIVLYRRNLLKQYVSVRRLQETGIHKVVKDGAEPTLKPIVIDENDFRRWATEQRQKYSAVTDSPLMQRDSVVLSCEALVADPEAVAGRVFLELGLGRAWIHTGMRKQRRGDLANAGENYDEIACLLKEEFATMELREPNPCGS